MNCQLFTNVVEKLILMDMGITIVVDAWTMKERISLCGQLALFPVEWKMPVTTSLNERERSYSPSRDEVKKEEKDEKLI